MKPMDTYEGLTTYLNGGQEKIKYPDRLASILRNSHEHQKKNYKKKAKLISLRNKWLDVNKQLTYKNDYDRVVDVLKNTNSKGLTHEVMESRQSHLSALVKDALPS
jgi:hypothetical protein